ncbi:Protein SPA1-RELATED 3 [Platanthera zijinensis]|uniref:Protein SPA1-RELATED 3 n=1 Tax=Platanthera zijinensis TaxID=2320716 RepID=A0AAP0BVX8_9ASPA
MGAEDDTGPPSKRVKGSSFVLENFLRSSSLPGSIVPLGGPMARPLPSQGKEDFIGSKGVIKRVEFIRIITKTLYSLGYEKSGKALEEESGVHLHSSAVILFRKQVLDRNWDESITTLQKIRLDGHVRNSASFLILEYKFFDLLEKGRVMDALRTLRSEIAPLNINKKRLHQLSSCIISSSQRGLIGWANLDIDNGKLQLKLLDELQKVIPPTVMIPEKRLETLVEQALSVQREACFFHNSLENALSLYTDHLCGKDQLPSKTLQILQVHEDEIWFLQFSYDGKCLASSSNDGSVIIWEVHEDGEVSFKCTLKGHQKPVVMIAWSPDGRYLLSCGMEEVVRCWDVDQAECLRVFEKHGLGLLSCVWYPDGKKFFSGVTDRSISLWDLDGNEVENWKGHQTTKNSEMAVAKDGKQIIIMCKETTILMLDWETKTAEPRLIEEDHTITSFSLSRDENFLLVNLSNQEIHLWSIASTPTLVKKYQGHTRSRFVIRSCFGGFEQSFVASGSEDSQVYIWHKQTGELVQPLAGHSGAVNCVSWNPGNPYMLASGSDDHTIRIWGLNRVNLKRKDSLSNGYVNHCNGTAN